MIANFITTRLDDEGYTLRYSYNDTRTLTIRTDFHTVTVNLYCTTHDLDELLTSINHPNGTSIEFIGDNCANILVPESYNWFELDFTEFNSIVFGLDVNPYFIIAEGKV